MRYLYLLIFSTVITTAFSQTSWIKKNGPLGGNVTDVEYSPGTSTVWSIVESQVYKSTDDGNSWVRSANATLQNNSINDIEIVGNTMYFLGYDALYTSTDQGLSLVPVAKGKFFDASRIKKLPSSGTLVIITGNFSPAFYYSTNSGVNWTAGASGLHNASWLAVNSSDQVFAFRAVSGSRYAVFRSVDNGATFIEQASFVPGDHVYSLTNSRDNSTLYAVSGEDIRSSADGSSSVSIKGGEITDPTIADVQHASFITSTADGLGMYFVDSYNHKLYSKATNAPASDWKLRASDFPVTGDDNLLPSPTVNAASGKDFPSGTVTGAKVVFGSSYAMFRSVTGGASNVQASTGIAQLTGRKIMVGAHGELMMQVDQQGVLRSVNSGDSWTRVTTLPKNINEMTAVVPSSDPKEGMVHLASSGQDLYQSGNQGETWTKVDGVVAGGYLQGGDQYRAFFTDGGDLHYSKNGGLEWTGAVPITGFSNGLLRLYVPTTTNMIYAMNGVEDWYKINLTYDVNSDITSAVAVAIPDTPVDGNIYAAKGKLYCHDFNNDRLYVFNGTSWSSAKPIAADGQVYIPQNNGYVFVTSGSPDKVFLSRDDGDHFTSTDLPSGFSGNQIGDVAITPDGYAFLSTNRNVMLQGKNKVVLPNKPDDLTQVGVLGNAVVFKWNDNSTNETAHRIMRSSDGGTNYSVIGTVERGCDTGLGEEYFTDNTVVAGTSYKYKIRADNEAGNVESSEILGVSIPAFTNPTLPDNRSWLAQNSDEGGDWGVQAPKVVSIQKLSNGHYQVSDIFAGTRGSSERSQEFYVDGTTTMIGQLEDFAGSETVYANGTGTWNPTTNVLTLRWVLCQNLSLHETITYTLQNNDPKPDAPDIQALAVTATSIEINWTNVTYANDYILERSTTSASSGFAQLGTAMAYPATSTLDNAVTEGTTYYYRLTARNANTSPVSSDLSNVAEIEFTKPQFVVSATTVSSYVSATLGSYWADFDNDGNMDLFTVEAALGSVSLSTIKIFKNLGNGNFEIKSPTIDGASYGWGAVSDINNDGKMDISLAISETAQIDFYKGNGDFTFTKFTASQLGDLNNAIKSERQGIMWGDVNNDGLLDVIFSGDYDSQLDDRISLCIQNPDGTFKIVDAGELDDITASSFSTYWIDFNNDTFIDVLVGGIDPTGLYKNNGDGTFTLVPAGESGITGGDNGGITTGDFNNDGYMDFVAGGGEHTNTVIYLNDHDGGFTLKDATALSVSTFAISPVVGDLNNDGLLDVVIPGFFENPTRLFINTSTGSNLTFNLITTEKMNDNRYAHLGAAVADYDKNGFLDIAMASVIQPDDSDDAKPGENFLFKNTNTTGNWLQVKLAGQTANKHGLGARVTVTAGGKTYSREVVSSTSFVSLNSLVQHFGVGAAASITKVEVKWPTDPVIVQTVLNPAINTIITINENSDPEPPVFGSMSGVPTTANKSALAQSISVPITDNKAVTKASIFVKSISATEFTEVEAISIGALTSEFGVEANKFDAMGIQYYFRAEDAAGNFALSPADAPTTVYKAVVNYSGTDAQIPAALIGSGGAATGWKVISIPFALGSNNGVQTVFDELTGVYKIDYRMVTYTETPAPAWQDYLDKFSTIDRGIGYMINIKTPVTIVVGDNLLAPSNTRADLFKMQLKAGWNMIGNPYLESINWSDAVSYNSIAGTGTTMKKFSGGSYSNGTTLLAYEGGFVHMDADLEVSIPFGGQTSARIEKISFGPGEWLVPISIQQGEITNNFGGIGMHSEASLSFDKLDDLNAPRWFEFLEMNFNHPEHNAKMFARDVVPMSNEFAWSFNFDSNIPGIATMNWDSETYTLDGDLYLYDEATQTPVNMKENASYSFDANVSRNFKVFYGPNALSKIKPAKVMLGFAHPNPTSNVSAIGFSVPEVGGKMSVRLEVFDLTGRKVGTLANGEFEAGFYSTEWHPQEGAVNGMYVYRLTAGDEILGGKIILRK